MSTYTVREYYTHALPWPRTDPEALEIPLTGLRVAAVDDAAVPLPTLVAILLEDETLGVRPRPGRTLPLDAPRAPLLAAAAASARFFSSSSAFLAAASLRCCNSSSRRSFSCCLAAASLSIAAMSCEAPCHLGFRISL